MQSHLPLYTMLDQARGDLETATRQFRAIQLQRTELEKRLQAMINFHCEYRDRLAISARTEPEKTNWRNADHFVAALLADIEKQREVLATADRGLDEIRRRWQELNQRVGTLDLLAQQDQQNNSSHLGLVEQPEPEALEGHHLQRSPH